MTPDPTSAEALKRCEQNLIREMNENIELRRTLERYKTLEEAARKNTTRVEKMNGILRREGLVIDNFDDPWKKLVLTYHLELVEADSDARDALDASSPSERGDTGDD